MAEGPRVLQVLGRSAGGIARHVRDVVGALNGHDGMTVDVAGPAATPGGLERLVLDVAVPDGPFGHGPTVARLRARIEGGAYDVVHAHGLRAGIDAARAGRKIDVPVIVTVHNLVRPEVAGRARALFFAASEPLVVALARRVLAVSEDIAARLRARSGSFRKRVEVLHLGIPEAPKVERPAQDIRRVLGVPPDGALVVTVARLSPQKALHVLLEAMSLLGAETVLAILGQGPLEDELRARAARLGVADRVRFLGYRVDVADHMAAGDVFCLSSVWEGVPLAAQEAMLLGVPVVATDVGGMSELVSDGVSGRLVPPNDAAALAGALREVLGSAAVSSHYAERARRDLAVNFSTDHMLDRLAGLYEELS